MWTIPEYFKWNRWKVFKIYDHLDQPVTDFEYFSGHLKRKSRLFNNRVCFYFVRKKKLCQS